MNSACESSAGRRKADAINAALDELDQATTKFGSFNSAHEGYAVIKEEFDEMWDEIKRNDIKRARQECVQVAAMALRFLIDIQPATETR